MCIWAYTRCIKKTNDCEKSVYHHPENKKDIRAPGFQLGIRHLQCFMIFLCLACSFCIRGHVSVTLVSMTEKSSFNDAPVLPWDSRMKGTITSSFYWTYIFLLVPAGQLSEKFGPKYALAGAMLCCGIIMVLTPFAAIYGGFYCMIISRMLQGATQAFTFPSVNVVLAKWAPKQEKIMLSVFVFSGMDFGTVVIMAMAGSLADSRWGWPSIFYACGGFLIAWALLYAYVGANSPQDHSSISEREKLHIWSSLRDISKEKKSLETPWKAMLTSVPLLAVVIAHIAGAWGFYTILFQVPSYLNAVLGFNMKESGFLSALPYLASLISGNIYAVMNYWLNSKEFCSRTVAMKAWNSFSFFGVSLSLIILAFVGKNDPILAVTLTIVAVAANSAERCGFLSNHILLAPNFAGTLMGITAAVSTVGALGAPLYAGFIVLDPRSEYSWRIVFLTAAAAMTAGNLAFIFLGSAKVQSWNFPSNNEKLCPKEASLKDGHTG